MGVTIKQIADICGVSRETVYRVLNSPHRVNNVKSQKVLAIRSVAKRMGYEQEGNAAKKQAIGVILASEKNAFFDDIINGLEKAYQDLKNYGLEMILKTMHGYDVQKQLDLISSIEEYVDLVILNPINNPLIAQKIDELSQRGIPVINLNTDIENSRRLCYVGSDYYHGGRMAGNLIALMHREEIHIGIIGGARNILGHQQRIQGFRDIIATNFPHVIIDAIAYDDDEEETAMAVTRAMLTENPRIRLLYVVAAGISSVCREIFHLQLEKNLDVIGFDSVPSTIEHMKSGLVKAVLFQQPVLQGYKAMRLAFYYLVSGDKPEHAECMINTTIKIRENVEDNAYNDIF